LASVVVLSIEEEMCPVAAIIQARNQDRAADLTAKGAYPFRIGLLMEEAPSSEPAILNEITQIAMKPVGTGLHAGVDYRTGRAPRISLVVVGCNGDLL